MSLITRKEFVRLGLASAAAAALPKTADAQTTSGAAAPRIQSSSAKATLIRGVDVLTMDDKLGELTATDVLIRDGKIAAIGKNLQAEAEIVDAKGMILIPGLVDGHRHVWETLDLGRMSEFDPVVTTTEYYFKWQLATVVSLTPEDSYLAELIGGLQAIDSGVTSVLDYAHGQNTQENALAAARGLKDSGIGGWFGFQLGASYRYKPGDTISYAEFYRTYWSGSLYPTEKEFQTGERLQKELFSDSAAPLQLALAPICHTGSLITDIRKEWTRIRGMGIKLLPAHMHKSPSPEAPGHMGHRDSGVAELNEAGMLGPDVHSSHGNALTGEELKMLHDTGGMICVTPMDEYAYVRDSFRGPAVHGRARAAGVATGIGLDVPLSLPGDYFEHIRTAYLNLYSNTTEEGRQISSRWRPKDTLDLATAGGAKAIRKDDVTGSITVGKRADLVLLRTDRIGFGKVGPLVNRVVTFASAPDIDSVWVAGTARKRHGKMLGVDWQKLQQQLNAAQERVARRRDTIKFV